MEEECVMTALNGVAQLSGDAAFDRMYKLIDRIGKKRWEEFEFLLGVVRFFGGRIALIHVDDLCSCEMDRWGVMEANEDGDITTGLFRPLDTFIELPLHHFTSWVRLEQVLRHEIIHMLQHYTDPNNDCPCCRDHTHLLNDSVPYGSDLASYCRKNSTEDFPDFEVEAYITMTWAKIVRGWAEEVISKGLWIGKSCDVSSSQ